MFRVDEYIDKLIDLCHLLKTTKDYYGELKNLVPAYTFEDERNYVKFSLNMQHLYYLIGVRMHYQEYD